MSQDIHTLSMIEDDIAMQVSDKCPDAVFNILVGQVVIAQDAKNRIEKEGIVVRNLGGLVIPHPAIKIQNEAEKIIANLLIKFGRS